MTSWEVLVLHPSFSFLHLSPPLFPFFRGPTLGTRSVGRCPGAAARIAPHALPDYGFIAGNLSIFCSDIASAREGLTKFDFFET